MNLFGDQFDQIGPVLEAYPPDCEPQAVEPLAGAGGLSGARFWRLRTTRGDLCLRRWPVEHPAEDRLQFIQAVLWHVQREGFEQVPVPVEATSHAGYVSHAGHFWQLEPWMAGRADVRPVTSPPRLEAALTALARFHLAAASFPLSQATAVGAPGIVARLEQTERLLAGELDTLGRLVAGGRQAGHAGYRDRAERIVRLAPLAAPAVRDQLSLAARMRVRLQPCIRDIHRGHVLFERDEVTGLIDFGAMRPDGVAGDVARLLGSMAGDDQQAWRGGLSAYSAIIPLAEGESRLVTAYDRGTVLLSGINWIRWIFQDRRHFDDPAEVLARMDEVLRRLERLAGGY